MSNEREAKTERFIEISLIVITISLGCLFYMTTGYKMVVLNLFFLPVVLAGFFLGRYRAGVLAVLSVATAGAISAVDLMGFSAFTSPLIIGLAIGVWAAVLGLTSLLVGTLSDERTQKMAELHEAYVGVVEVLSRYLQSANPRLKARSDRVAELSQRVAFEMKLSPKEADDIRVAALLHDMESIEITARVIRKAMGSFEDESGDTLQATFHGTDLVQSLGAVLTGAMPLLVNQAECGYTGISAEDAPNSAHIPVGAKIIRTVRAFVDLREGKLGQPAPSAQSATEELRRDADANHDPAIVDVLERVGYERQRNERDGKTAELQLV